jgi:hypothetical protein
MGLRLGNFSTAVEQVLGGGGISVFDMNASPSTFSMIAPPVIIMANCAGWALLTTMISSRPMPGQKTQEVAEA